MKFLFSIIIPLFVFGVGIKLLRQIPIDGGKPFEPALIIACLVLHALLAAERQGGRLVYRDRVRGRGTGDVKKIIWWAVFIAMVTLLPAACGAIIPGNLGML
jgi:hypothetical protein